MNIDDWNYYGDSRVRARERGTWYESLDEQRMIATVLVWDDEAEDERLAELSVRMDVCPTCEGRGKHVNPSIDAGGISVQDFAEDPDFHKDYLAGVHDVTCYECRGRRVVAVPRTDGLTKQQKRDLECLRANQRSAAQGHAEMMAERRMGA